MTEIIEQNFNNENDKFIRINNYRKSSKNEIVIENNLNEQDITELIAEVIAERIAKKSNNFSSKGRS